MTRLPRPAIRFGRRLPPVQPAPAGGPARLGLSRGIQPGDKVQVSGAGLWAGRATVERIERRGAAVIAVLAGGQAVPVGRCRRVT